MARLPDWPARLAAQLAAAETRPFDAHRWNCGQFALAAIRATTGRGQPWRGMAKTLRRDGGYVWSESLIIPVLKRGEVTGYMSIRSEASQSRSMPARPCRSRSI